MVTEQKKVINQSTFQIPGWELQVGGLQQKGGSLCRGLRYNPRMFLALGLVKASGLLKNIPDVFRDRYKKVGPGTDG